MIVFQDKLGQATIFINFNNCGFYGKRRILGLALYLKMFVLVTTIRTPNFMLVSKSAQLKFLLYDWSG